MELRTVFFLFSLICALLMLLPAAVCGRTGEPDASEPACYGTDPADKQAGSAVTEAASPEEASPEETSTEEPVITDETEPASDTAVPVYMLTLETAAGRKELAPEDYVRGILMGEMLSSFDTEAWKALAVAARTYVFYRVEHGLPLSDDAGVCCAYLSDEDAEKRFGEAFSAVYEKAWSAADATAGEILLYDGAPACTMFHAMSYEKTASAEAVFGNAVPYLVSVSTPETLTISGMVTTAVFDRDTVNSLLGVTDGLPLAVTYGSDGRAGTVVTAKGQSFSGTAFRSRLSLRSCA
ncbi:MAG: SpoIID/LytB domain-containing protein, partial [Eubacteriales bacterium]